VRNDRLILGAMLVGLLGLYTTLVFGFFDAESESRQFYLFLIGLPVVVLLTFFPRAALISLAGLIYGVRWLYDTLGILPRELTWLGDIFIAILVVRTLFMVPFKHERLIAVERYIIAIFVFAGVSAILNGTNAITLIAGLRMGFRYVLLFLAAYHMNLSRRWVKGYFGLLFFIGLVQTPITWIQYSQFEWRDLDSLCGTFGHGGTPGLGFFLLLLFIYMIARMVENGRLQIRYLLFILWMSIAPFFGEVKFYFMFMPLALMFILRTELRRRPVMSVLLMSLSGLLIIGLDYVVLRSGHWDEGRNLLTFAQHLPEYFNRDIEVAEYGSMERGYRFVNAIRLAAESPRTFFFGNGPGSITESFLSEQHSAKLTYYAQWGLSSADAVSFVWLLIEYGYLGVVLLLLLLWLVYRRARFLRKAPEYEDRVWGRVLEALTFTYVAWMFYQSAWQLDSVSFAYWPLAGMIVRLSRNEELSQIEARRALAASEYRGFSAPTNTALLNG
jgi:hypothetical protein